MEALGVFSILILQPITKAAGSQALIIYLLPYRLNSALTPRHRDSGLLGAIRLMAALALANLPLPGLPCGPGPFLPQTPSPGPGKADTGQRLLGGTCQGQPFLKRCFCSSAPSPESGSSFLHGFQSQPEPIPNHRISATTLLCFSRWILWLFAAESAPSSLSSPIPQRARLDKVIPNPCTGSCQQEEHRRFRYHTIKNSSLFSHR